jgi:uncharacterized protein
MINPLALTDELFLHYQRCHRRTFLECYGDPDDRQPPHDYLHKIKADSLNHRAQVLADYPYHVPLYPETSSEISSETSLEAGHLATVALMQQGVTDIQQGILRVSIHAGITLVIQPDLLQKHSGSSQFGDWFYVPVQAKLGRRPKMDYQLTVTFQAFVLAQIQGFLPKEAWLILRGRGWSRVSIPERIVQMQALLTDCVTMLQKRREPEVFITRSYCPLCVWLEHCSGIAQAQLHLSLLPGITPKRYVALQTLGIRTVEGLLEADRQQLSELPGFDPEVTAKMLNQARSNLEQRPLFQGLPPGWLFQDLQPSPKNQCSESEGIEFYFDLEAQPDLDLVYLYGVLRVDRQNDHELFQGFLAEDPTTEGQAWQQFLNFVLQDPQAPIYHFCSYELETVRQLAKRYGLSRSKTQDLLDRFVDIHAWVTKTVSLPIENYALKTIARWLGFGWRQGDVNGAQAICWYDQWLETGDRDFLAQILCYNEDDCRGTYWVKQWLTEFVQMAISEPD